MKSAIRYGLALIATGLVLAATGFLNSDVYSRNFDLGWDEDVQLHDGRVIAVNVKYTYERLGSRITPYGGTNLPRDTTLTIDAGGGTGRVTQLFKGFKPMFLGQHEGVWYGVLYGSDYYRSRELPGQDWGELEGPYGQWGIKLVEGKWQPMSMSRLPAIFQRPNMLLLYGEASEHARFIGGKVTLQDKVSWLKKHPPGYSDVRLTRPTATSPKRPDAIPLVEQAGSK